ncbi:hypothetical protein HYR69_05490 [Candidatus Sumerlaeota bacterium]|nr:hypothetical protein [Candidatus Sumerlaeota bacterium]
MKLRDQSCELISVGNDTIQMKINGKQWKFVRGKTYRYPPSGDDFINIILKNTDTEAGTCTIRSSDGDLLTYGLDGQVKIAAEPQ